MINTHQILAIASVAPSAWLCAHHLSPGNSCDLCFIIANMSMCLCAALYIHAHVSDFIYHMNEIQPTELDIIVTISVFLHPVSLQDTVEYKLEIAHASASSQSKWI